MLELEQTKGCKRHLNLLHTDSEFRRYRQRVRLGEVDVNRLDRRVCFGSSSQFPFCGRCLEACHGRLTRVQSLLSQLAADSGLLVAAKGRRRERRFEHQIWRKLAHPPKGTLGLSWL